MDIKKDAKPFLLGALAGAVLIPWIGFELVGWNARRRTEASEGAD